MTFTERVELKMRIDALTRRVGRSLRPAGATRRLDREAMRSLLKIGGFQQHLARDVEMYLPAGATPPCDIMVLDNDLPVYHTTIADVLMRKSPTVKEMISIRNAVKILNDSAVRVRTQQETLQHIQADCLATLVLTVTQNDLDDQALEGRAALDGHDAELVMAVLRRFAELTGFSPPPQPIQPAQGCVFGQRRDQRFGPSVAYLGDANALRWIDLEIDLGDRSEVETYIQKITSPHPTQPYGMAVFDRLVQQVRQHCAAPWRMR